MNINNQKAQIHYVILRNEESYESKADPAITRFFTRLPAAGRFRMTEVLFGGFIMAIKVAE